MPSDNGLRLDKNQGPFPSRPKPPEHHPEQFVRSGKPRLRMLLFQNGELLAQSQIFQQQVAARTNRSNKQDKQVLQRTEHKPVVAETRQIRFSRCAVQKRIQIRRCSRFVAVKALQSHKNQQGLEQLW
jgi:hypothetical protein